MTQPPKKLASGRFSLDAGPVFHSEPVLVHTALFRAAALQFSFSVLFCVPVFGSFLVGSGDHMGRQVLNPGWPCTRQTPCLQCSMVFLVPPDHLKYGSNLRKEAEKWLLLP